MSLSPLEQLEIPWQGYPAELSDLEFVLPPELEATEPPEARGLGRDQVRMMVSHYRDDSVIHTRFREVSAYLQPGDVLVINTSRTMNAALSAIRPNGSKAELHLSTHLQDDLWVVELRRLSQHGTLPMLDAAAAESLELPGGAQAELLAPYHTGDIPGRLPGVRLWLAQLDLPDELPAYLDRYGFPIRYQYVRGQWPLPYYQTVFATETGSAEMPSAGRAFTPELVTHLVAKGIQFAPLLLHTGVASPESYEPPYEEFYRVPPATARLVNAARCDGGRIIAVGTTAVRALETASREDGSIHPSEGWTSLVITPQRGLWAVEGLLTGFHEPRSSHLAMLAALAGYDHLRNVYHQAMEHHYLWHEFGDLHLILP